MKRLIIFLVLVVAITTAKAERISESDAAQVAYNFMGKTLPNQQIKIRRVKASVSESRNFYVYQNEEEGGWVMLSADDRVMPVLAYSKTGRFDINKMPVNAQEWFKRYEAEIEFAAEMNLPQDKQTQSEWNQLKMRKMTMADATEIVSPLVTTTWDQAPYYNEHCPTDYSLSGYPYYGRPVTGCVATAMAQVMKYWEWPKQGTGSHSYSYTNSEYKEAGYDKNWPFGTITKDFSEVIFDWKNMPAELNSMSSKESIDAVAELMFCCGVACNMMYGEESGAVVTNAGNGMIDYFSYSDQMEAGGYNWGWEYSPSDYDELYTETEWKAILKKELDEKRPIIYSGGAHCFVCDGYDSRSYFHFNWGWGGVDDGFYSISALRPAQQYGIGGGDYDFSKQQWALFNIRPNDNSVKPADEAAKFNLQLTDEIQVSSNTLAYAKEELTFRAEISNIGDENFVGSIEAIIYSEDSLRIFEIAEIALTDQTLSAGEKLTTPLITCNLKDYKEIYPGRYYLQFFYATETGSLTALESKEYASRVLLNVVQQSEIEMMTDLTLSSGSWYQEDIAGIFVRLRNVLTTDFEGEVRLSLLDPIDNATTLNIRSFSQENGNAIPAGDIANAEFTVVWPQEGQYRLLLEYRISGTDDWLLVGGNYLNPLEITILKPELPTVLPDAYEYNNTEDMSFLLGLEFVNDIATVNTETVTIHDSEDVDFYHLKLKTGYDYVVNATLYHAGTSKSYSVAVQVIYKINNNNWSRPYDSRLSAIQVTDGGELMLKIEPQTKSEIGTYQLIIQVSRRKHQAVDGLEEVNSIGIYPNPATEYLWINSSTDATIQIIDLTGDIVLQTTGNRVDVSQLQTAGYIVRVITDKNIKIGKFIKK